jgi:tight adherence protein C
VFIPQYMIPLLSFGAVAAATYALLAVFDPYWARVQSRVGEIQRPIGAAGTGASIGGSQAATRYSYFVKTAQRFLSPRAGTRPQLRQRLAKAGIYHRSAPVRYFLSKLLFLILAAAIAIGAGIAGYIRIDLTILLACVSAGFGSILPSLWLDRAIAHQHLMLRKALPDFLDLMTVCLEGGLSLQETIRRVSDELRIAHPTLAVELSIVQRDIELGATVDQALKRFAIRTDYEGVRTLSTFIREAQRFGTNITEALRSHADMLRSQREQSAEENAQKAAVKILIPTLLFIFPAIFVVTVGPAVIQIQQAFAAK